MNTFMFLLLDTSWVVFYSISHNRLELSLSFWSTKCLCQISLLFVVGFIFRLLLWRKLFLETINSLRHLVSCWCLQKVTLLLAWLIHSNVVVTCLVFGFAVLAKTGTSKFECLALGLQNTFLSLSCWFRWGLLFIKIESHLIKFLRCVHGKTAEDWLHNLVVLGCCIDELKRCHLKF